MCIAIGSIWKARFEAERPERAFDLTSASTSSPSLVRPLLEWVPMTAKERVAAFLPADYARGPLIDLRLGPEELKPSGPTCVRPFATPLDMGLARSV